MVSQRMGSALKGAGTGALGGLATGTPIGVLLGALGGGAAGYFGGGSDSGKGGGLLTRPGEERRFDKFTPEQQQLTTLLRNLLTGQGEQAQGGLLGSMLGPEGFDQYAAPAMRQYQEEIVPGIAQRFAGLGALSSSGFQQTLARSGENLAARLGEARGQQQQGLLGSLLGQVMQPQYHTRYTPGGPTDLSQGLRSLAEGYGQTFGQGAGAGTGAGGGEGDLSDLLSKILGGVR